MENRIETEDWSSIKSENSANRKMDLLQNILVSKFYEVFPQKIRKISSDDEPYFTEKLASLKRKKCREFNKKLQSKYSYELDKAKKNFYRLKIKNLRKKKPKLWHKELKKLTRFDQHQDGDLIVESIKDLPNTEQAELIADKFAAISQEYQRLEDNDVKVPLFTESDIPIISEEIVKETLRGLDINKSNVQGDIPNTILKFFADLLANPIAHVLNASIRQGCWPDILKMEIVTPVPKKFPPKTVEDLRNISGLLNLDKIAEKIISKMMVSDMKENIDPSQYANQKGKSIQHYLVSMIDRILGALDKNSKRDNVLFLPP